MEKKTEIISYGSKDPNNRIFGPKYYTISGIWALKPYYLGLWTLTVGLYMTAIKIHSFLASRRSVIGFRFRSWGFGFRP